MSQLKINGKMVQCQRLPEETANDGFIYKQEKFPLFEIKQIYNITDEENTMNVGIGDIVMLEESQGTLIKVSETEFLIPYYKIIAKIKL